ncbi:MULTISPECIES: AI-2E family transporter [Enterococcus]|uniref:AI-2E family transporter n=1 Tax=Candidatus Enterococcus ferrettii TaxID=2815324 RepID=A0ABV0ESU4_9ENTE|nr:AI-2E family transporter [Enterococcus sp. 665A]MBO1338931.1 AI-2E family transporter [Enterococcus sp. 665A]
MYQNFIENIRLRRFVVLAVLILVIYLSRSFITIALLTFIFTYLSSKIVKLLHRYLKLPNAAATIGLYLIAVFLLYLLFAKYATILAQQAIQTYNSLLRFYQHTEFDSTGVTNYLSKYFETHNWQDKLESGAGIIFQQLQNVGRVAVSFFLSFLLSFFFMIEKERTFQFSRHFLNSDYDWFFQDVHYFAKIFTETFGVVLEVQLIIALVNTGITTAGLALIGFNQLPSLAIMIFFLSLVPVAGVIISFIPLTLIAYSINGLQTVVYVLLLVMAVHVVESYILNPKLMSSRTKLPIFYTFVILLLSERFLGVWGLIVGIPIFTFFLEVIHVQIKREPREN